MTARHEEWLVGVVVGFVGASLVIVCGALLTRVWPHL